MKPFLHSVTYKTSHGDIVHTDTDIHADIEDSHIKKAHAVCMHEGKLLMVNHSKWNVWGLPGGTRENEESVEEALKREIEEETNCRVETMVPISHQKVVDEEGNFYYGVQYFCKVIPNGEFEYDVAGNINKIEWIDPLEYGDYIEDKDFRKVVVQRVVDSLEYYKNL